MSEGAERAIISDYASPRERGTAFGWYHLMKRIAAYSSRITIWFDLAIPEFAGRLYFCRWAGSFCSTAVANLAWAQRRLAS